MRKDVKLVAPDIGVLGAVALMSLVGAWLVFDASYAKSGDSAWTNHDIWYAVKRQLVYVCVGLIGMIWASKIRLATYLKMTTPILFVAAAGLVAVMMPGVGYNVNGAARWFKAGPISIQPSELAKLALVLYLGAVLARRKMLVRRLGGGWLTPACVVGVMCGLVVIEPDLGTAICMVAISFVMLFAAGALKRHLVGLVMVGGVLGWAAVTLEPYRMERIRTWLNPWRDPYGDGYQIIHSLIALGTGGSYGVGLCEGREKLYIPAASTDFIFATLGEEAGLIGCLLLLAGFVFLTYRGLDIARRSKSSYGNLLAVGVTSMIGLQALINIAVVSSSIPATGVPLPFISYGGSSLVLMLMAAGVLLSISRQINVDLDERDLYESSLDGWRDGRAHLPRTQRRPSSARSRARNRVAVRR